MRVHIVCEDGVVRKGVVPGTMDIAGLKHKTSLDGTRALSTAPGGPPLPLMATLAALELGWRYPLQVPGAK